MGCNFHVQSIMMYYFKICIFSKIWHDCSVIIETWIIHFNYRTLVNVYAANLCMYDWCDVHTDPKLISQSFQYDYLSSYESLYQSFDNSYKKTKKYSQACFKGHTPPQKNCFNCWKLQLIWGELRTHATWHHNEEVTRGMISVKNTHRKKLMVTVQKMMPIWNLYRIM